jgi:hypothetical protein
VPYTSFIALTVPQILSKGSGFDMERIWIQISASEPPLISVDRLCTAQRLSLHCLHQACLNWLLSDRLMDVLVFLRSHVPNISNSHIKNLGNPTRL